MVGGPGRPNQPQVRPFVLRATVHENLVLLRCASHWTWQDTNQQLLELAVAGLAGAQAEVESARAAVHFAEQRRRQAIDSNDREQESKWEQEVEKAEQKVEKAKQEVKEAEQKVEKAKQEVKEAKQEVRARAGPTVEARAKQAVV